MKACVYICHDCPTCERVVSFIKSNDLSCQIINVQDEKPKIQRLQIFPALFIDERLVAYGDDILDKLTS